MKTDAVGRAVVNWCQGLYW